MGLTDCNQSLQLLVCKRVGHLCVQFNIGILFSGCVGGRELEIDEHVLQGLCVALFPKVRCAHKKIITLFLFRMATKMFDPVRLTPALQGIF